jgi:phosphate-selective porin OprO/OprP
VNGSTSITNNTAAGNGGVNNNGGQGNTSWELNGRVSGTPWMESPSKLLHVGGWGSYINLNNNYSGAGAFTNGGVVFANGIGNNMDRSAILSTGNLTSNTTQANHLDRFGFETALVNGPFSAQAEYLQTGVHGTGYGSDTSLNGYYGYMTYFLTGESRNYVARTASFDRVKPKRNFDLRSGGGLGAWEVAAGYDYVNLNSNAIQGGRASTVKFGVNWYPNPRVRLMTNYIHALDISTTALNSAGVANPYNNAKLDMIEERVQIDW